MVILIYIMVTIYIYIYGERVSLNFDCEKFQKKSQMANQMVRYIYRLWDEYQPCFTFYYQI